MKLTRVAFLAIVSLWLFGCDNLGIVAGNDTEQEKDRSANQAPPADETDPDAQDPGAPQDNPDDDSNNPPDNNQSDPDTDVPEPGDSDDDMDNPDDNPDDPSNDPGAPPDDVGSPVPPLPPTRITDNVFLPYTEEVAWHYDNSDVVTLGPPRNFAGRQIRPLRHSLDVQVFGDEFFYVGDGSIFYGGVNINAEDIPNLGAAEARIEFSSLRLVYDQFTDSGSWVFLKRGTIASEPEYQNIPIVGAGELWGALPRASGGGAGGQGRSPVSGRDRRG